MSSFVEESLLSNSRGGRSKDRKSKGHEDEQDLFPQNKTLDESKSSLDNEQELNIKLEQPYYMHKNKGGSSNRKYRKQSKTKFRGKQIETEFDALRNDPFHVYSKNAASNNATNQTMPMFSSNVTSPMMANMVLASTTKNNKRILQIHKRPISAVMTKRMSPHSSVDFHFFDNKSRTNGKGKVEKRTINELIDENIKLKTTKQKLEAEVKKKDRIIEDILMNQNNLQKTQINKLVTGIHASAAMKKHLTDLKQDIMVKEEEITRLK